MLIKDNRSFDISFAVADFAKENQVWPVTLYPYTSHKLHTLDRILFKPFKRCYSNAHANRMYEHPNTAFSINGIAGTVLPKQLSTLLLHKKIFHPIFDAVKYAL